MNPATVLIDLLILCLIGVVLYFINVKVPMPDWLKWLINIFAAVCIIWWLVFVVFDLNGSVPNTRLR